MKKLTGHLAFLCSIPLIARAIPESELIRYRLLLIKQQIPVYEQQANQLKHICRLPIKQLKPKLDLLIKKEAKLIGGFHKKVANNILFKPNSSTDIEPLVAQTFKKAASQAKFQGKVFKEMLFQEVKKLYAHIKILKSEDENPVMALCRALEMDL